MVIAKLDRAFRSQRDCVLTVESWMRRGVVVHMLDLGVDTSTHVGQMVMQIIAAVAQWESSRIGERIREAKAAMRRAGRTTNGQARIGYVVRRGRLKPDTTRRRTHALVVRLRDRDGLLWREIAERLNEQGLRTARRQRWTHQAAWRAYQAHKAGYQ